jgi:hypothetical protein
VCADIRDGLEQLLPSKGRIQMSKTNYLQTVVSDLQRTAAMIGRPQWMHGDRGHHALLSGKPWSGKNSGGLTLHAAQTRMMVPGHFLYAQS